MRDRVFALSAVFGLLAGIGHGVLSHHAGLPVSLSEQLLQPLQVSDRGGFR